MDSRNHDGGHSAVERPELLQSKKCSLVHDLLVVGGGAAGACAARTAVRLGARVVLVTRDPPDLDFRGDPGTGIHAFRDMARSAEPWPGERDESIEFAALMDSFSRSTPSLIRWLP